MITELKQNVIDAQTSQDLDRIISYSKEHHLSFNEVSKIASQFMNQVHSQGSSWLSGGDVAVLFIITLLIFGAIFGITALVACMIEDCS